MRQNRILILPNKYITVELVYVIFLSITFVLTVMKILKFYYLKILNQLFKYA